MDLVCAPRGFPRYEVGSYLGGGISGVVYEIEQTDTAEACPVPLITPSRLGQQAASLFCGRARPGFSTMVGCGGSVSRSTWR